MFQLKYAILFVVLTQVGVNALKILVISPVFGRSHMQFMGNLADLYVQNGHDVVYFEPEVIDDDPILKFESSKRARVIKKKKDWVGEQAFASFKNEEAWSLDTNNIFNTFSVLNSFSNALANSCESILSDRHLLDMLKAEKFDIAVAEYLTVCPYVLYRMIGIERYITASATPVGANFGGVFGVASIPTIAHVPEFFGSFPDKMSFLHRLNNVLMFGAGNLMFSQLFMAPVMGVINKRFPDILLQDLIADSSYVFINSNEHFDFARSTSYKFINIAGIGVPKPKQLPGEYQKLLDTSKNGVVLVSFGSIAQSQKMPPQIKQAFLDTFNEFPDIQFIWKYENSSENVAHGHSNVMTKEWVPQVSLFNHKNLIGFVTHGGMNSLIEATTYGIPTICLALFGDQIRNCKMMAEGRGMGINLKKIGLTKESLTNALHELVRNKNHLNQARQIGQMIKKQPMSPEQRVLKYTAFAAEFDIAANLDSQGRHLSSIQFYNVDVFALLIFVFIVSLFVFVKVTSLILRCLCGFRVRKSKVE